MKISKIYIYKISECKQGNYNGTMIPIQNSCKNILNEVSGEHVKPSHIIKTNIAALANEEIFFISIRSQL